MFADATFPDCNDVPSGRYFLRGVASHQQQICAKAWRDSATIIQMKRGGGDGSGRGKAIGWRETRLSKELEFLV